jgi:hypothetical protein
MKQIDLTRPIRCQTLVRTYIDGRFDKIDQKPEYETFMVWFSYILGGWKSLVGTTLPDGMYYEITYNKEKCETYIDAYKKFDNVCIPDAQEAGAPS